MASTMFLLKVTILAVVCYHQVMSEEPSSATNNRTYYEDQPEQSRSTDQSNVPEADAAKLSVQTNEGGTNSETDEEKRSERDTEIFRKLFLQKRAQHISAVDSLLDTYEYEKTYQMIDLLLTRMRTVVGTSKATLVGKGFEPGMLFPTDDETKEALSVILENAGLFGDMALKLPDITHSCLSKKNSKISEVLKWAITFSQDVGFLDEMSTQMLHLASQELDIIPKEPGFVNPYRQDTEFKPPPSPVEKKKKAKAEKKRGPKVTKVEL